MAHIPNPDANRPDPALVSLLDGGLDASFERARSKALETLDSTDIVAVWLQATGDGTTLDSTPTEVSSPNTTPQITHLAGYADDFEYPQITQLARQLFGHHLGVLTDGRAASLSNQDALTQIGSDITQFARMLSEASDAAPVDYPIRGSLSTRLEQATDVLSDSDLTLFWLQVLRSDGTIRSIVSTSGDEQPFPQEAIDSMIESPIAYVMGVPNELPPTTQTTILSHSFAQHALVGANTAAVDLETFSEEAVSIALEAGYHEEVMSDI
ncbi:hypothetical protein ACFPYI_18930 [Halomarina salina]|uniref:Uncharacterized protein n=1 Tax=Halomarina salina TaxID=1872699 RepID=A0ABD5RSX0_9EURY|nr:hypothetical protein [Halomarina salina]